MAIANINWPACGASSDGQYLYYGKTSIATGNPVSGTGWTLYTGAPLGNSINSANITGLDDNVEYTFYIYCHCPTAGNGPLTNAGPFIKYICPTFQMITPSYNGLSYTLSVPNSANNTGSWIQNIVVSIYDSSGLNLLYSNTHTQPFSSTISGSFTGLVSSTSYNVKISYTNNASRTSICSSTPFNTSAACVAPTVTLSNPTSNTIDVSWTPATGGGTFDILANSNVVASGLTTSPYTITGLTPATIYQINVRKNCTTGGSAISTTQSLSTTNANVDGIISMNSSVSNTLGHGTQGTLYLLFSFAQPTAFPMTLYFGYTSKTLCGGCPGGQCNYSNGYDIFTVPSGAQTCPTLPTGNTYSGPGNYPFVVNIPQGVTSYNSGTNINTTYGGPVTGPWINTSIQQFTDLYVKVNSPSGNSANFTIANGANITGVTIHNV